MHKYNKLKLLVLLIITPVLLITFLSWIQDQRVSTNSNLASHYSTAKDRLAQYQIELPEQPVGTAYALEHIYFACDQLEDLYVNQYNCCRWWNKNSNCSGVMDSYKIIGCETPERLCNQ